MIGNPTFKKKFSIVIPYYNASNFLKDSIDSIINQTLDFEKNIELILVDDGSTDNSNEIALTYKERYPNNIITLSQKHEGQASAKNFGFIHATGEYINFLDSDDYLSENALSEVLNFFEEVNDELNVVTIPIVYFDRCSKQHKLNNKFEFNRVIELDEEPEKFLLSSSPVFIKTKALENLRFDEQLMFSDSKHFILKLLSIEMGFGVINTAKYFYRKRSDLTAISDNRKFDKNYYLGIFEHFYTDIINYFESMSLELPEFIQYAFVYDLHNFIKEYDVDLLNESELNKIHMYLYNIFKYIDKNVIINTKNINFMIKSYLYYLKFNKIEYIYENDEIKFNIDDMEVDNLNIHKIWINKLDLSNDFINLSGFFNSYFSNNIISIEAIKKGDVENVIKNSDFNSSNSTKTYLDDDWHFNHKFSFNIPINNFENFDLELIVKFFKDGDKNNDSEDNVVINHIPIDFKTKVNLNNENLILKDYDISFSDNIFQFNRIFNFSIISAIYNTEEFLAEAIDSVINQSLDFEKNVQLILVDDGSIDNSKQIALDYQSKYPKNIVVLSKMNGGQASARNLGIKHASGRYLNFLDSDDYLSENTLNDVLQFFNQYPDVDVVAIPMTYFGRREHEHILNSKFDEERVIQLNDEPNNPLLSCSSSFFRKSALGSYNFDTHLTNLEDALLINKILLKNNQYGVINSSKYYYRKRFDSSSTTDTKGVDCENFVSRLKQFHLNMINQSISEYGHVKEFIQYLLIYDLQWMIDLPELELDELHAKEFWYYFDKVMEYINAKIILNNNFLQNEKKLQLYYLKVKDLHVENHGNNLALKINKRTLDNLEEHMFWLDIVEIENNYLNISGFLNSHFNNENLSIEALKVNSLGKQEIIFGKFVEYSSRQNINFLSIPWGYKYNFDISIPLLNEESSEIQLRVNYHDEEIDFSTDLPIGFLKHAQLSEFSNYKIYNPHLLKFENNKFYILPRSNNQILRFEFSEIKLYYNQFKTKHDFIFIKSIMLRLVYVLSIILRLKRKPIYLFMDRIESADDNAEALFKYSNSIDDNVKKYFVIDVKSKDYNRLSHVGKVLPYGSNKHKIIYLYADKIISSHPDEEILNPYYNFGNGKLFNGLINVKSYFLQHGVTLGDVSKWLHKFDKNLKLIVTVSEDETNSFFDKGYNFSKECVQLLGFPRFDNLSNDNIKKQIILMPTWRKNIEQNKNVFINSNYYKRLNSLLNNELFIECCNNFGYDIIFKPHPRLYGHVEDNVKFIDLININENIILSDDSYRELFNDSSLLITDYSSVAFDFAYLKKPIIYYQPDDDYHHDKSYFSFKDMGFGEVVSSEEELLETLNKYFSNDCDMGIFYKSRVDEFYKFNDKNNCKRVYEWIKTH